jgi:hypothetical protein
VVECLPSKCETLSSSPSAIKNKSSGMVLEITGKDY